MPMFPRYVYFRVTLSLVVEEELVLFPIGLHLVECSGGAHENLFVGVRAMREMKAYANGGI